MKSNRQIDEQIFSQQPNIHSIKIVLLGDGAVGKTSIRRNYIGEGFSSEYLLTIGADFALQTIKIKGNQLRIQQTQNHTLKVQIWDLAGQPRFSGVRRSYYLGCLGGILVFDRTRAETFENMSIWLNELWKCSGRGPIPFVILGNKSDLLQEDLNGSDKNASLWAKVFSKETNPKKGFKIHYLKSSAKTGQSVKIAFEYLVTEILNYVYFLTGESSTS